MDLWLGALKDNGGDTYTRLPGAASVAIDVIDPDNCVDAEGELLTNDQRGVARPQVLGCDVGAVEVAPELSGDGAVCAPYLPTAP